MEYRLPEQPFRGLWANCSANCWTTSKLAGIAKCSFPGCRARNFRATSCSLPSSAPARPAAAFVVLLPKDARMPLRSGVLSGDATAAPARVRARLPARCERMRARCARRKVSLGGRRRIAYLSHVALRGLPAALRELRQFFAARALTGRACRTRSLQIRWPCSFQRVLFDRPAPAER